jgi:hypothetical protein
MENEIIRGKAHIQQDPDGERIIVFPNDFCEKADLRTGDIYNINVVNGEIIMIFIERPEVSS